MDVSFFAEMAAKSALIAGAALALAFVLRSRSAADRALVLRIGVAMLLLMPPVALALPSLEIVAFAAPEPAAAPALAALSAAELGALVAALPPAAEPTIWDDPTPLLVLAYLGGLLMVGARLAAGLWTLRRWTRSAEQVTCPDWLAAFDRTRWTAPDGERIRLLVSDEVPSPLSWGWRRPAILIDRDTLAHAEEADAILAHEVAHVARRDWPVLLMTRLAATLFWFNPLVWLLDREVVQQAEEAADCAAAERVEPTRYAETLLTWAQGNAALPANSIAPGARALARRIRTVLDRRMRERPSGSAWTAAAILACIAIAAPVAAAELVAAARGEAPQAPPAPGAPPAPAAAPAPLAGVPAPADAPEPPPAPDLDDVAGIADRVLAEVLPQIPTIVANATAAIHPHDVSRATEEAVRAAHAGGRLSRAEAAAAAADARRAAAEARAHARVSHAEIEAAVRESHRVRAEVAPRIRASMAHGAEGMLRGADGMEAGARQMEETARRLRTDRAYRERQIARAREEGRTVTHEELIEAADGMMEGAEGMREGARDMRRAAQRMREGRH